MDIESRGDLTRSRLISAAISAIDEKGYHGATFVEIAQRSGLSRGAIHHHFESVPDLMIAVVQDIGEQIREGVVSGFANFEPGPDVYDHVIDFVWAHMNATAFRALIQIRSVIATDPGLQDNVRLEVRRVHEWWYEQADTLIGRGTGAADRETTRIVLSALSGAAMVDLAIGPRATDPDREAFRTRLKQLVRLSGGH